MGFTLNVILDSPPTYQVHDRETRTKESLPHVCTVQCDTIIALENIGNTEILDIKPDIHKYQSQIPKRPSPLLVYIPSAFFPDPLGSSSRMYPLLTSPPIIIIVTIIILQHTKHHWSKRFHECERRARRSFPISASITLHLASRACLGYWVLGIAFPQSTCPILDSDSDSDLFLDLSSISFHSPPSIHPSRLNLPINPDSKPSQLPLHSHSYSHSHSHSRPPPNPKSQDSLAQFKCTLSGLANPTSVPSPSHLFRSLSFSLSCSFSRSATAAALLLQLKLPAPPRP